MAPAQGWHAKSWSVPHFYVRPSFFVSEIFTLLHFFTFFIPKIVFSPVYTYTYCCARHSLTKPLHAITCIWKKVDTVDLRSHFLCSFIVLMKTCYFIGQIKFQKYCKYFISVLIGKKTDFWDLFMKKKIKYIFSFLFLSVFLSLNPKTREWMVNSQFSSPFNIPPPPFSYPFLIFSHTHIHKYVLFKHGPLFKR